MNAYEKNYDLARDARDREGITLTIDQANTLRRAELTLHRWAELECGDSNDYASWAIERDEITEKPYRVIYPHTSNNARRYATPDREAGALKRIASLCADLGINFYHQTDPRGAALYVSSNELTDQNYYRAICCAIR